MSPEPLAFLHCPRCGTKVEGAVNTVPFTCAACGLVYYFNVAVSVAALILRADGRGLFIRRAREPAKGKLAMVGGFVDTGETLEGALRREVREEVNLEIAALAYLGAFPNRYEYLDVVYPTLDVFFTCAAVQPDAATALDDVESVSWHEVATVTPGELAFTSMREALAVYVGRHMRSQP